MNEKGVSPAEVRVIVVTVPLLRRQADIMAGSVQGPTSLAPMRKDVVLHYNLFGDPALRIRKPAGTLKLEAGKMVAPGKTLTILGETESGPVEVTFECARDAFYHPIDLKGDSVAERVARRYRNANNKVILRKKVQVRNGVFETSFELPEKLEPGTYWVKACTSIAVAALKIPID